MVVTDDAGRAELLACLRAHGGSPKYYHKLIGGNFRLDALQAAVVSAKLRHLDAWTAARQKNAALYSNAFEVNALVSDGSIILPIVKEDRHIFNQYVIRTPRRDALRAHLTERGVGTEIYYPLPLHLQECFAYLGYKIGAFPESERAAEESLALPIYPELSEGQIGSVVDAVREFF